MMPACVSEREPLCFVNASRTGCRASSQGVIGVRTIVIQSYRDTQVEPWVKRCMQSVRDWASSRGYDYEFVDDTLFDFMPARMRNKNAPSLLPQTDVARLGLLRDRLTRNYERAIWMDADILVFDQTAFAIPDGCGAMLCHEVWTSLNAQGELTHWRGINNSLLVFERGHPLLDFLRFAVIQLHDHIDAATMSRTALGTDLLTKLGRVVPLQLHAHVACLSPMLIRAAYYGDHPAWLRAHAAQRGQRFHAANLCRSLLNTVSSFNPAQGALSQEQILQLVEQSIDTRGRVLFGEAIHA